MRVFLRVLNDVAEDVVWHCCARFWTWLMQHRAASRMLCCRSLQVTQAVCAMSPVEVLMSQSVPK